MLGVGVIGCGYWGPNLIRNFNQLRHCEVRHIADLNEKRLMHMQSLYPHVRTTTDFRELLANREIDIIAVATPVFSHHALDSEALRAGKHVFIEKPITASSREAEDLIHLAKTNECKLMVGHTFEYTSAVKKIKEIIDAGELGDIYYINSQRLNLGLFQPDINVLWDLAPHDISIILYLLGEPPETVSAVGASHVNPAIEDVAILSMQFSGNRLAFVQTSWLDPDKIRKITVVGSKKMIVFDDVQPTEKIRIYDKGVEVPNYYDTFAEFHYSYKYGDIVIPKLDGTEPLHAELAHFVDCVIRDDTPVSDGESGLRVVRILEAAQTSLKDQGRKVALERTMN